jgi:hypothetical protein
VKPLGVVVAGCALLWSAISVAQQPEVGVSGDDAAAQARNRVIQELASHGYEVRELDRDEDSRRGVSARLIVRERRIEVKVSKRNEGGFERREAVFQLGIREGDLSEGTLRAIEFLRASLLEVGSSPPPERKAASNMPAVTPAPHAPNPDQRARPSKPSAVQIGLGTGVVKSEGKLAPNAMFSASLGLRLLDATSLRLRLLVPLTSSRATEPEGDATIRPTMLGLGVAVQPFPWTAVRPFVEATMHVVVLSMEARAAEGYLAQSATRMLPMPMVGAGVVVLPGRVRLRVEGVLGAALQRERAYFNNREVLRWGDWVAGGLLSVDVGVDG